MSFFSRLLVLVALLGSAASQVVTFLAPVPQAISGSWIQAYSSNLLNTTFETNGFCVQVYVGSGKRGNPGVGSITIGLNLFSPTGVSVLVTPNLKANADNSYSFESESLAVSGVSFGFIALSPIEPDTEKYTWAGKQLSHLLLFTI
jgi:hypothetical protein